MFHLLSVSPEAARVDYTESWRVCHQAVWCRGCLQLRDIYVARDSQDIDEFAEEIVGNTVGTWSVGQ